MSEPPISAASSSHAFDPSQWPVESQRDFLNTLERRVEELGSLIETQLKGKNIYSIQMEPDQTAMMDKWLANEQNDGRWDQALAQTTATLYGVVSPTKEQIWNIIDEAPFDLGTIGPSEQATIAGASEDDETKVPCVPSKGQ